MRDCVKTNFIKYSTQLRRVDTVLLRGGSCKAWRFVFLSRVPPCMPFPILNYLYGTTGIPFLTYSTATFCGVAPGTFLYVYLGHALHSLTDLLSNKEGPLLSLQSQAFF